MPQPKGFEPFTRYWTVNWSVIFKTGSSIPAGTLFNRPRSQMFGSLADAQAFYNGLLSQVAKPGEIQQAGHPAYGTVQAPFLEIFHNKKSLVIQFVDSHVAFVRVSTI